VKSLLEAQNVTRVFGSGLLHKGRNVAVDGVSLIINEDKPSITAIAGESGSGKTTLARLLLGMIQPTSGSILYRGHSLTSMDHRARKEFRRQVQAIFQDPYEAYNPVYKVDQTLTTPVRKLSGGQRQRIMVARALLLNPRVILADEPVSMVDASLRATILESLVKLKRELGISLVYITHDLTTAYQVSQNIYVLYRGSVAEVGSVEKVIGDPQHPYTRLLVSSIPLPDPDIHWGGVGENQIEAKAAAPSAPLKEVRGCKFSNRCPYVMAECREAAPPLYLTGDDRAVACYLYKDGGAPVSGREMAESLARD